jgi:hypothetical protein
VATAEPIRRAGALEWWQAALLAPLVFLLHVMEEAPRFVAWLNSLVRQDITQQMFWRANLAGLAITVLVAAFAALKRTQWSAMLCLGWLSMVMLANSLLHIAATLVHQRYSPGTFTSAALYLPYFGWYLHLVTRAHRPGRLYTGVAVLLGALPMLVHGYLIVFRGSRLM